MKEKHSSTASEMEEVASNAASAKKKPSKSVVIPKDKRDNESIDKINKDLME